jgi:hypothetical protein
MSTVNVGLKAAFFYPKNCCEKQDQKFFCGLRNPLQLEVCSEKLASTLDRCFSLTGQQNIENHLHTETESTELILQGVPTNTYSSRN